MNLYELIKKNMTDNPESIAVSHNQQHVTYRQLNIYTNAAEKLIRANGIKPGDKAVIYMKNSITMIVSILACLKSGIIILPVDESQNLNKLSEIYIKSGAKTVLCNKLSSYKINLKNVNIIDICPATDDLLVNSFSDNIIPNEQAYCIFTSGTSKEPKGVLLTHKSIFNHIKAKISELSLDKTMKIGLTMNIGFVASIWIILSPLIIGAQLFIYDKEIIDNPLNLYKQIHADGLTVISLIPQYIRLMMKFLLQHETAVSSGELKFVISTGDKLTTDIIREFYSLFSIPIINAYGQSECSDDTFHYAVPFDFNESVVPIGFPISGCLPYIMDENMQETEIGEIGELYISGSCLSEGYIDDQNNYRFMDHPDYGTRMFRTGDLVSRNDEGLYFYHGRTDNQIKVNGQRISPEEIEEKIKEYQNVRECIAGLVERQKDSFLVALVSTLDNSPVNRNNIMNFLRERLPSVMIPRKIISIESIPTTSNGKADRQEVLKHIAELYNYDDDLQDYINNMPEQERFVTELVLENLGGLIHRKSQIDENIEDVGVDSMMFINLVVEIEEVCDITFEDDKLTIMSYKNLHELVEYVMNCSPNLKSESRLELVC